MCFEYVLFGPQIQSDDENHILVGAVLHSANALCNYTLYEFRVFTEVMVAA